MYWILVYYNYIIQNKGIECCMKQQCLLSIEAGIALFLMHCFSWNKTSNSEPKKHKKEKASGLWYKGISIAEKKPEQLK